MKTLLLCVTLLLTGCSTVVPVTQKFPGPPGMLAAQRCPDLQRLEQEPQLSQIAKTVVNNYSGYWQCAVKVDAWIDWYNQQKIIHEGLK